MFHWLGKRVIGVPYKLLAKRSKMEDKKLSRNLLYTWARHGSQNHVRAIRLPASASSST